MLVSEFLQGPAAHRALQVSGSHNRIACSSQDATVQAGLQQPTAGTSQGAGGFSPVRHLPVDNLPWQTTKYISSNFQIKAYQSVLGVKAWVTLVLFSHTSALCGCIPAPLCIPHALKDRCSFCTPSVWRNGILGNMHLPGVGW